MLLKEVHHRVKNNMMVIMSLMNIQSDYVDDEAAVGAFEECRSRIRAMSLVHEKLYQSEDFTHIDLGDYIRPLTEKIFKSHAGRAGNIGLEVSVDDTVLGIDAMIPCGLIINELVSNSLKHAFEPGRKGEIHVSLKSEGEERVLVVRDDGRGMPEGLDVHSTRTLGLQLVNSLVKQLRGSSETDADGGTGFVIRFREKLA